MKFELAIALKYLLPRRRHLTASMIGFVSILVISLVVWFVIVFLSVTEGMEKNWINKLIALNAPMRVEPKDAYFQSYYYKIDLISESSNYRLKTLAEKLNSQETNPYNPQQDLEIPADFSSPDLDEHGNLIDLAKEAQKAILKLPDSSIKVSDYEMALGQIRLHMIRPQTGTENFVTQVSYLTALDKRSAPIDKLFVKPTKDDDLNILLTLPYSYTQKWNNSKDRQKIYKLYFQNFDVTALKTPAFWQIPKNLFPKHLDFQADVQNIAGNYRVIIGSGGNDRLSINDEKTSLYKDGNWIQLPDETPLFLKDSTDLTAHVYSSSFLSAYDPQELLFEVKKQVQNFLLEGRVPLRHLKLVAHSQNPSSFFPIRESIWLPKSFKESGALIGDTGTISYYSSASGNVQEQQIPVVVAGFYDAGLMPGKFTIVDSYITSLINGSNIHQRNGFANGFQVWFDDPSKASELKKDLEQSFQRLGLDKYFRIQTFEEYDFAKDLVMQLKSDRHLFTLIALIIILVACSNIISMLLLLVNDKKREIGIYKSLGASSLSIAQIFGYAGIVVGIVSSLIGLAFAAITLHYLNNIISWISSLQGYDVFNAVFYGANLPDTMSQSAVILVLTATAGLSLLAGLIPALRASRIQPIAILRSDA